MIELEQIKKRFKKKLASSVVIQLNLLIVKKEVGSFEPFPLLLIHTLIISPFSVHATSVIL